MIPQEPERLTDTQIDGPLGELAAAIRDARSHAVDPRQVAQLARRLEHALSSRSAAHGSSTPLRVRPWSRSALVALTLIGAGLWARMHLQAPPALPPAAEPRLSNPGHAEAPPASVPAARASSGEPVPQSAPEGSSVEAHTRSAGAPRKGPPRTLSARKPERLDELGLLRSAQAALGEDAARSLALADEHFSRFPRGVFAEEREMLAIEALQKLRRRAAALARARAFVRDFPESAHARRVQALLATGVAAALDP